MRLGTLLAGMVAMILALILVVTMMSGCYLPQNCHCPQGQSVCEWQLTGSVRGGLFPNGTVWEKVCRCKVQEVCYAPVVESDPFSGRY